MGFLFDLIYDWIIHIVPSWLWWVLVAPLFAFLAFLLVGHFYPVLFSN
jgi:hypothetical protein